MRVLSRRRHLDAVDIDALRLQRIGEFQRLCVDDRRAHRIAIEQHAKLVEDWRLAEAGKRIARDVAVPGLLLPVPGQASCHARFRIRAVRAGYRAGC